MKYKAKGPLPFPHLSSISLSEALSSLSSSENCSYREMCFRIRPVASVLLSSFSKKKKKKILQSDINITGDLSSDKAIAIVHRYTLLEYREYKRVHGWEEAYAAKEVHLHAKAFPKRGMPQPFRAHSGANIPLFRMINPACEK